MRERKEKINKRVGKCVYLYEDKLKKEKTVRMSYKTDGEGEEEHYANQVK